MKRSGVFFSSRIRRNLGYKLLGTVAEKGLRLILTVAAARLLGTAAWGQYGYALALSALLLQLTDMGLNLFLAREIARDDLNMARADFVGQVYALKGMLSGVYLLAMAIICVAHLDEPVVAGAIALCALAALGNGAVEALLHLFRGVQDLALEAHAVTAHSAAQLVLGVAALATAALVFERSWSAAPGAPGEAACLLLFCAAMALASLVAVAVGLRLALRIVRPRLALSAPLTRRFVSDVLPLGIAIVASMIYYRIDVPMIRYLLGDVETGLYTAGYKVLEYSALAPAMMMAATFPALSEAVARDPRGARTLHRTALGWLVAAGTTGALVLGLAAEPIIALLYGDAFAASAPILRALAPCVLLTYINYLLTHMLVALGLVRQQMVISLSLVALNVGLNAWWIPLWGGAGAAWATAVTELALLACCVPLVWRGLARAEQAAT